MLITVKNAITLIACYVLLSTIPASAGEEPNTELANPTITNDEDLDVTKEDVVFKEKEEPKFWFNGGVEVHRVKKIFIAKGWQVENRGSKLGLFIYRDKNIKLKNSLQNRKEFVITEMVDDTGKNLINPTSYRRLSFAMYPDFNKDAGGYRLGYLNFEHMFAPSNEAKFIQPIRGSVKFRELAKAERLTIKRLTSHFDKAFCERIRSGSN